MKPTLYISIPPAKPQDGRSQHNHRLKLERLIAAGKLPVVVGKANLIDVAHDNGCGIFRGGFCDCDPDIKLNGRIVK